jgi:hypothetical protein
MFSIWRVFTGCLVSASHAVAPSVFLLHGSGPRWLAPITQLDSSLLRNGLQQWGLLRLPRLHQGRPSATISDGSVSQLLNTDSRISTSLDSRLTLCPQNLSRLVRFKVQVRVTIPLVRYRQSVHLGYNPLETEDQRFFQLNPCVHSPYVTSSLMRTWICLLSRWFSWYSLGTDPAENKFSSSCDIAVTQPPGRTAQRTPLPIFLILLSL